MAGTRLLMAQLRPKGRSRGAQDQQQPGNHGGAGRRGDLHLEMCVPLTGGRSKSAVSTRLGPWSFGHLPEIADVGKSFDDVRPQSRAMIAGSQSNRSTEQRLTVELQEACHRGLPAGSFSMRTTARRAAVRPLEYRRAARTPPTAVARSPQIGRVCARCDSDQTGCGLATRRAGRSPSGSGRHGVRGWSRACRTQVAHAVCGVHATYSVSKLVQLLRMRRTFASAPEMST